MRSFFVFCVQTFTDFRNDEAVSLFIDNPVAAGVSLRTIVLDKGVMLVYRMSLF